MRKFCLFVMAASFSLVSAGQAAAGLVTPLDVEGTWTASVKCKGLAVDGTKLKVTLEGDVLITQSGTLVVADTSAIEDPVVLRGITTQSMCGDAFVRENKTEEGAMSLGVFQDSATGSGDVVSGAEPSGFGSISFTKVKVFADTGDGKTGRAKGVSSVLPGFGRAASCKWKMTRTSEVDPGLSFFSCIIL